MDQKEVTALVLRDLSKAFGSLCHKIWLSFSHLDLVDVDDNMKKLETDWQIVVNNWYCNTSLLSNPDKTKLCYWEPEKC
jgi:hypothetical protein